MALDALSPGQSYDYDELSARLNHLDRASRRDPSLQPFEGLYRHDAR